MNLKYTVLIACSAIFLFSCGDKISRPAPVLTADQIAQSQSRVEAPTIPSGGVVSGVKHYTCPNGHAGSDTQGSCMSCGATLEHNQAFHNQPAAGADPAASTGEPPQNAAGVWHYTCPNGHDGGGGSATACEVCGTTLVHNTVYHNTGAVDGQEGLTATPAATTPGEVAPPVTAEPPQNADGVWHYTCPNGHDGGGGSATACSECGTTLVHNTAYH